MSEKEAEAVSDADIAFIVRAGWKQLEDGRWTRVGEQAHTLETAVILERSYERMSKEIEVDEDARVLKEVTAEIAAKIALEVHDVSNFCRELSAAINGVAAKLAADIERSECLPVAGFSAGPQLDENLRAAAKLADEFDGRVSSLMKGVSYRVNRAMELIRQADEEAAKKLRLFNDHWSADVRFKTAIGRCELWSLHGDLVSLLLLSPPAPRELPKSEDDGTDDDDEPNKLRPFEALVKWRDSLALDWWGEDLVGWITPQLARSESITSGRVPKELHADLLAFQALDEDDQYEIVRFFLREMDPRSFERSQYEEDDDDLRYAAAEDGEFS